MTALAPREPVLIVDIERHVTLILSRLLHPGRLGTTAQQVSRDVQACLADVARLREVTTPAAPTDDPVVTGEPAAVKEALLDRLHQRLGDLAETLAAQDDEADTLTRVRSAWQRGLDEPRPLGVITVTDWPDVRREIPIDELNAVPFAVEGQERLQREPNGIQRRRLVTSLKKLLDLLALGRSGSLPNHAAPDAPRDPDPAVLKAVYQALRPVISAAKKNDLLPDSITSMHGIDHETDPSEMSWRLIAARCGYPKATSWRTVKAHAGGYTR
jgi:hypothetical protein